MRICLLLAFTLTFFSAGAQSAQADSIFMADHYTKQEVMIPMRDGIKLYTAIYIPKDKSFKHPILFKRTPYSCQPYGPDFLKLWATYQNKYIRQQYIIVIQDVRGRYMSEGKFVDVRPFVKNKTGAQTDEASDTYDTIDWLVNNVAGNNGNVGVFGISYPGFYSTMASLSNHPALKAVSPQAPVTDWFLGDDFHHNGALMLIDAFSFYSGFGVPRPAPTKKYNQGYNIHQPDKYKFFLETGALANFNKKFLGDSIEFWNDLMTHPVYDDWWQSRNPRNYVAGIQPAILTVGGLFDAEDLYGSWNLYKAIEKNNPSSHFNKVVMGPWLHGTWEGRSSGESLGDIKFGNLTSKFYQDSIEFPFFQQMLNGQPNTDTLPEATVFFTGENKWHRLAQWPPKAEEPTPIYLLPRNELSFRAPRKPGTNDKPVQSNTYTQYISDPAHPVPFDGADTIKSRTREYMTGDQRFASRRKDVLTFQTKAFTESLTLAGPITAELMVSASTTDADFVVKLIDVFPANIASAGKSADTIYLGETKMNNYQMLVRGEIMRGKFRNSFEAPEPFVPNKITKVAFDLPDVAHTFLPGHKLMIQIQSSWFPLADRNPQTFTDIYKASNADFKKATIRVFHADGIASKILLPVIK